MTFQYQVNLNDPRGANASQDAVLVADMNNALAELSQYVSGQGILVVDLNIAPTPTGRADGASTSAYSDGTFNGNTVLAPSPLYELTTGQHISGTTSDIVINVSTGYFKQLDLSKPFAFNAVTSKNTLNPTMVFTHELFHGFGIEGYYSQSGALPGGYESLYDTFIQRQSDGTAYYTGQYGDLAYGGPVPLTTSSTTQNYYHFGNTLSDINRTPSTDADPLTRDLMNGIDFFYNYPYKVSNLDLGVLQDLGYNITTVSGLDSASQEVERLYYSLLNRSADASSLSADDALLAKRPGALQRIANSLIVSSEYHGLNGHQSNAQFVEALYEAALGRPAEAGAIATDAHALAHGLTRQALAVSIAESSEAVAHLSSRPA